MRKHVFVFLMSVTLSVTVWAGPKRLVTVQTTPADALVSVHKSSAPVKGQARVVAGHTPLTKELDFGKAKRLWLEFEKRGYATKIVEITPEKDSWTIELEPLGPASASPQADTPAEVKRIAVVTEAQVYRRSFSKENNSPEESHAAAKSLAAALVETLDGTRNVISLGDADAESLGSVWRDVHGAFELIDPIRLRYLPPSFLETRSARESARKLGESTGADALLLVSLHQTVETKGLIVGKTAILAGGTAASYSAGYANAISNHQSFFVYTVYLPEFAQGAAINAVLIDCRTGEILWANRGIWKPLHFDNSVQLTPVFKDLLMGLP